MRQNKPNRPEYAVANSRKDISEIPIGVKYDIILPTYNAVNYVPPYEPPPPPPPQVIPTTIGEYWAAEGGYYAGKYQIDGTVYALVMAPKQLGETTMNWSYASGDTYYVPNARSMIDGKQNTQEFLNKYETIAPNYVLIPTWAKSLTIAGFTDWYIPSYFELEMMYRYFKPSTHPNTYLGGANPHSIPPLPTNYTESDPPVTPVTLFLEGASQAFGTGYYWTSYFSQWRGNTAIQFINGYAALNTYSNPIRVRAVRRVLVE